MFDRMLCKLTHKKVITLKDVINELVVFVWLVVYPIFEIYYCVLGGSFSTCLKDTSPFCRAIDVIWCLGILFVFVAGIIWLSIIYDFAGHVKIAECPLNKE